jgi:hypothetical protein
MTRIRITSATSVSDGAGNRYGAGQVVSVPDDLATAWLAAGHAEPYEAAVPQRQVGTSRRQAADGRRRATRQAPRTAATKTAGVTSPKDAAVDDSGTTNDSGAPSSDS